MSEAIDKQRPLAPPGSPKNPQPRESNVSSVPRPSQSQAAEDLPRLDTVYFPPVTSGLSPNVDIVAVHGLIENADSTWLFTLQARTQGSSGSASGKRDTTFRPAVDTIKEGGVAAGNRAGSLFKTAVTTAAKQFSNQAQQPADAAHPGQHSTGETAGQDENRAKPPHVQSSNTESVLSNTVKVNWLKDNSMLPRSFPRARIMQFSYEKASLSGTASENLKAVASKLLQKLSDIREEPGLSRPIVFIGHGFGGIVISEALIMAKNGDHSSLFSATAGLVFLGTPFQGSAAIVSRLSQKSKSKLQRSGAGAVTQPQADTQAGTLTPPHKPVDRAQMFTLLDLNKHNAAMLEALRQNLKTIAAEQNIPIACFFEKLPTEAIKPFSREFLVEQKSAVLDGYGGKLEIIGLPCNHSNLSKFSSFEDSSYLRVKDVIKDDIDFTATRRLWDAISTGDAAEVRRQISKGADVNRENPLKRNALHLATEAGDLNIVKLLLETTVEVNAKDTDLASPIKKALLKGKYDIVRALLKRGAKADDEDREIASNKDAENPSDRSLIALLDNVTYFEGPQVRPKKQGSLYQDSIPEFCRSVMGNFRATITTFHLRCEKDSEDKIRDVAPPDADGESSRDEGEREYHTVETLPLSELLYSEASNDPKHDKSSSKEWKWYHLPANNMDWVEALFSRLGVNNADGRLSGREHRGNLPHSLFLQPEASMLKGDQNGHNETVLFMPYLHFETNEGRIRLSNAVQRTTIDLTKPKKDNDATSMLAEGDSSASTKALSTNDDDDPSDSESDDDHSKEVAEHKVEQSKEKLWSFRRAIRNCRTTLLYADEEPSADELLLKAYLALPNHHLHIRRTLDQFYYTGMDDTESRDTNQVVQRYAVKAFDKIDEHQNDQILKSKLIMVDQLWLWVLGKNTVITSFPQGWGRANGPKDDHDGVLDNIQRYLHDRNRNAITSVDKLASVIILECTRVFGRFQLNPELQFLDFFNASINEADRHSRNFVDLDFGWDDEKDLVKKIPQNEKDKSTKGKKKDKKKIKQKKWLMKSVLNTYREVELLAEIQDIRDELGIIKMVLDDQHSVLTVPDGEKSMLHPTFPNVDRQAVDYHVSVNRKTIEHMISRTRDMYDEVYHLIDLKQKQANISEARYARKEASSAAKEGRTILALTIVNMIFLPLSFLASFFGLDIAEFPKDPITGQTTLRLGWVSKYVFGISIAIAIPSIALAMAIGPMAGFTKRLGRKLRYWGTVVIIGVLSFIVAIALVPVIAGLIIGAGGVALAAFILFLVALAVFYICRGIWECTPTYRRREARKRKERLDPEVAAQNEEPESQVNDNNRNGEGEEDEAVDEKGTRVEERESESQNDSGNGNEIEEAPQRH